MSEERTSADLAAPSPKPPPGWSRASKVAFDALPDAVKEAVAKREREVDQGFAKLKKYKGLDKYVEMAERSGTTLDKALEQYTGLEDLLRRDVFAGVGQILRNMGLNPHAVLQAYYQRVGGGAQEAPQAAPQATQTAPVDPSATQTAAADNSSQRSSGA